jgi:hypothetical protein
LGRIFEKIKNLLEEEFHYKTMSALSFCHRKFNWKNKKIKCAMTGFESAKGEQAALSCRRRDLTSPSSDTGPKPCASTVPSHFYRKPCGLPADWRDTCRAAQAAEDF